MVILFQKNNQNTVYHGNVVLSSFAKKIYRDEKIAAVYIHFLSVSAVIAAMTVSKRRIVGIDVIEHAGFNGVCFVVNTSCAVYNKDLHTAPQAGITGENIDF